MFKKILTLFLMFYSYNVLACEELPNTDFIFNYKIFENKSLSFNIKRKDGQVFKYLDYPNFYSNDYGGIFYVDYYLLKNNQEVYFGTGRTVITTRTTSELYFSEMNKSNDLKGVLNFKHIFKIKGYLESNDNELFMEEGRNQFLKGNIKPYGKQQVIFHFNIYQNKFNEEQQCYVFKTNPINIDFPSRLSRIPHDLKNNIEELKQNLIKCYENKLC